MPSRRGRGEGSIYRRGDDGRWVGAFSRDGRRWTVTGATRQEAQRKLSALVREIEQGGALGDSRQTVAHYWTAWLETVKATSETAWVNHEMYTRLYVIPLLGKVRLARLSPQHLQDFYATLINETGLSSTTVHHLHTSVHKALDAAVRLGLVPRNASEYVDPPRKRHYEIQPLTRDQVRAFLAAAAGERLEALYVAALATGMRQGELLALHWADVDFEECAIYVRWNVRRRDGAFHFKQPKTRKSRRRIALAPETLEYLRAHRTRQFAERLPWGRLRSLQFGAGALSDGDRAVIRTALQDASTLDYELRVIAAQTLPMARKFGFHPDSKGFREMAPQVWPGGKFTPFICASIDTAPEEANKRAIVPLAL